MSRTLTSHLLAYESEAVTMVEESTHVASSWEVVLLRVAIHQFHLRKRWKLHGSNATVDVHVANCKATMWGYLPQEQWIEMELGDNCVLSCFIFPTYKVWSWW
jgi:hypothetical protein